VCNAALGLMVVVDKCNVGPVQMANLVQVQGPVVVLLRFVKDNVEHIPMAVVQLSLVSVLRAKPALRVEPPPLAPLLRAPAAAALLRLVMMWLTKANVEISLMVVVKPYIVDRSLRLVPHIPTNVAPLVMAVEIF